jgi:DNA gyrase/topoisomerase IV subunit B
MTVISFWQAMRRRPEMYIGGGGGAGLLHIVRELLELPRAPVELAVEVDAAGSVVVSATGTGISVLRDERGEVYLERISRDMSPPMDDPASVAPSHMLVTQGSETVFIETNAPRLGLLIARGFSARLEVTSTSKGAQAQLICEGGELVEPVLPRPSADPDHLRIRFGPHPDLFAPHDLHGVMLASLIRDLAILREVSITLCDHRSAPTLFYRARGRAAG